MSNQSSTDPTINPTLIDQPSNFHQRSGLLMPILLTTVISAGVFGFGGYYASKTLLGISNVKTDQTRDVANNFSKTDKPEVNVLYRGTVHDTDVVFLTNWIQQYAAGIPEDSYTGKLYGKKTYSNGSKTKIDTYTDFRKIENPTKLISFGKSPVTKLYDSLIDNSDSKVFVLLSFASESVRDGKPRYSLYEIDTNTSQLKDIWDYDLETDSLKLDANEIFPSFGEITDNTYLTFSVNGDFNSWEEKKAILNLETGAIKYLPKSIEVKINTSKGTVSYKPVGNLNVKFYSGGGYTPEQVREITNATGQLTEELLP